MRDKVSARHLGSLCDLTFTSLHPSILVFSAPFSADLVTANAYFILRLPKREADPAALQAAADALRHAEELKTGIFATDGGTKLTYRIKHGLGYKTVTEVVGSSHGAKSREEILDLRAKKKSDKYC